jgi:hypothetical protein
MARIISIIVLAVVNAGFMIARIVDVVMARGDGLPHFSLFVPRWIFETLPESRLVELIALGSVPGLSVFLPVLMIAVGVVDLVRRRKKEQPTTLSTVLIAAGGVCLAANCVTAYLIKQAMPSMG